MSIGDELVLGQTVDTNSAYLSAQLARRGVGTRYHVTVADDLDAIADAIRHAIGQAQLLIISGGLGPTEDDLTRPALATALDVPLVLHEPSVDVIRGYFERRGLSMPDRNKSQAMHPRGTSIIANSCGTAPGIKTVAGDTHVYVVPGVPREMKVMFGEAIEPELDRIDGNRPVILTTKVNTFGLGESDVAERLGSLMQRDRNPMVGTTVADAYVAVRIRSECAGADEARRMLQSTAGEVERRLGPVCFGRDDMSLQQSLVSLLKRTGRTLATAESCTGGLVGKLLTDVPGSSAVYLGGWITYADEAKIRQLDLDPDVLETHGAVSEQTARQMAAGALQRSGAHLAIAVTGVAGPGGGTDQRPVGTVWIALASGPAANGDAPATHAMLYRLGGDREQVRDRTAKAALQMVRLHLLNEPLDLVSWGVRAGAKPASR